MTEPACALCVYLQAQNERQLNEILRLRLQVAEGQATVSARQDLEQVNARLAAANREIEGLRRKLAQQRKAG